MRQLLSDGMPVYLTTNQGKQFRLIRDWKYQKELGLMDLVYVIPKGYKSNLTSIPRWIWWCGQYKLYKGVAAIAHNYLYEYGFIWVEYGEGNRKRQRLSKGDADLLFLELLEVLEVDFFSRNLMFLTVCLFSRGVWSIQN